MSIAVDATQTQEMLCTLACLALYDDGAEITEEAVKNMIKAAGATVEPYWPKLFVSALKGQDVGSLVANAGAAGPSMSAGAAPAAGGAAAAAAAEPEPEEEEEEEEEDMGFSLFD
ncbi:hypothetical protein BVRB_022280 [Beta vulgaris subsp. vulgaris]|uniref:60S acidic ribosomal protein P1 n=1 Tax=Beta vulgaris subsp. vulgaris TaxID=3555 RepID=A0A0J8B052_BETVV|nr:hypothetical protein BVRB_022280 [Beta vulgaris subsp. vulgaris]